MSVKANHRSSYNSSISKQKQNIQNVFFLSETNFITIYHAQLFDKYLLVCTKKSISIYNTQNFIKEHQINVQTHFACFIPFTTLVVYPQLEDNSKKVLVFWNYKTKKVQAQMTFNFQIQTIKASRRCISLANLQHLYVIHFPSLKPIYQGFAGNGFRVVYDISREGLTIAHQTPKKGELAIKNFTNIRTNKLLLDINSRSRTQSLGKLLREQTVSKIQQEAQEQIQQDIKKQHYIKAHNENINIIRLSPNGYRVITASTKGTIIRLFSTLNGQIISEFRMGNEISNVVDACFNNEGSQIVCLNQNNQVNLFQARMSEAQLLSESSRRGVQIYQMKNPSSFFSFLGFLNVNLKNQFPFSYFKLDTNGIEIKQKREKLEAQLQQKDQKQKNNYISEIKEVQQSHLQAQSQLVESNEVTARNQQTINIRINNKQPFQVSETVKSIDFQQVDVTLMPPKIQIQKKSSLSGVSKFESIRSRNIDSRNKQGSLKSLGRIPKKTTEVMKFGQKESNMHFKGIINFGDITNVKVLQSKYYFQLKYDPFNGGKMIQRTAFNILKHPRLSDL